MEHNDDPPRGLVHPASDQDVLTPGGTNLMGEQDEVARDDLAPGDDGQRWLVFHTKPRQEKKTSSCFVDMGIRHYLPLRAKEIKRGGRRLRSTIPLFTGYVFACCDEQERYRSMQSGRLVQWLDVVDQDRFLSELQNIRLACDQGAEMKLFPRLRRGQWVRVISGPLAGVTGRVSRRKDGFRVVLEMTALSSAVAVEVDMQDVVACSADEVASRATV